MSKAAGKQTTDDRVAEAEGTLGRLRTELAELIARQGSRMSSLGQCLLAPSATK